MVTASPLLASSLTAPNRLIDSHGRVIHDLRVSITDRCNYKCVYCRTGEFGAQYDELSISDYLRLIKLFVGLGISKIRLTGGEPLLRRGLVGVLLTASCWTWRSPPTAICWTASPSLSRLPALTV